MCEKTENSSGDRLRNACCHRLRIGLSGVVFNNGKGVGEVGLGVVVDMVHLCGLGVGG